MALRADKVCVGHLSPQRTFGIGALSDSN
jgi:hypothetical protein